MVFRNVSRLTPRWKWKFFFTFRPLTPPESEKAYEWMAKMWNEFALLFFWHFKATQKSWTFSWGIFLSRHCRPKLSISCALWAGSNVEGISRRSHKMLTASTGAPLTGELMIVQDDLTGNLAPRWLIALEARSADWSSVWMWMTFHRWMLCSRALRWMTQDQ